MKTEILNGCDHVLAAAANGVYQGLILTLAVALGLRVLGRTNAATRHSIWMAMLLLLPAIVVAHYCLDRRTEVRLAAESEPATTVPASGVQAAAALPAAARWEAEANAEDQLPALGASEAEETMDAIPAVASRLKKTAGPPVPWEQPLALEPPAFQEPAAHSAITSAKAASLVVEQAEAPALLARVKAGLNLAWKCVAKPRSWNLADGWNLPRAAGLVVVGTWLVICFLKLLLLAWRLCEIRALKRNSTPADAGLLELFRRLRAGLGVKRNVGLRVSEVRRSPVVLGFSHPVVLLPPADILPGSASEMEHILKHELAHVGRGDDWANLLQHTIQAAFFFHPAIWWISRQAALEREIACDDRVLQAGGKPKAYALLLADFASRMKRCTPMLAPSVSNNKSQLQQRINMILDTKRNTSPVLAKTRMGVITSAAALLAVLAIYSGPRLVLAQTAPAAGARGSVASGGAALTVASGAAANAPMALAAAGTSSATEAEPETTQVAAEGDSGPRYKPDAPGAPVAPQTVLVAPPANPAPPVMVIVPGAAPTPAIVGAPHPMALPPAPGAVGFGYARIGANEDNGSIEHRLERLERMVHSLMARQNDMHFDMHPGAGKPMPKGPDWNFNIDEKQVKEMAEREAARAEQEAKRAAEEAKRAGKDIEKAMKEKSERAHGAQKEASERQIEALRRAKENLERQMERLDSQIERLEQDRDRLQEEQQRRSELEQNHSEDEPAVAEAEPETEPETQ